MKDTSTVTSSQIKSIFKPSCLNTVVTHLNDLNWIISDKIWPTFGFQNFNDDKIGNGVWNNTLKIDNSIIVCHHCWFLRNCDGVALILFIQWYILILCIFTAIYPRSIWESEADPGFSLGGGGGGGQRLCESNTANTYHNCKTWSPLQSGSSKVLDALSCYLSLI